MEKHTIVTCPNCKPHEYQDKRYGEKRRTANLINQQQEKQASFVARYRCTVCGAIHTPNGHA